MGATPSGAQGLFSACTQSLMVMQGVGDFVWCWSVNLGLLSGIGPLSFPGLESTSVSMSVASCFVTIFQYHFCLLGLLPGPCCCHYVFASSSIRNGFYSFFSVCFVFVYFVGVKARPSTCKSFVPQPVEMFATSRSLCPCSYIPASAQPRWVKLHPIKSLK